jgi:hypothetical protein
MTRSSVLVVCAVALLLFVVPADAVPTASCTDSWKSATSGVWGLAANWTNGIPTNTDSVCITLPGSYTVTLSPWSFGTADPNNNGSNIVSLTLGAAGGGGTQTLDIHGQGSTSNSNEQLSTTFLSITGPSTIAAHGALLLDSTDGGSTLPGNPQGGYAALTGGGSVTSFGRIETEVQSTTNKTSNLTQIAPTLTIEKSGSLRDVSGALDADGITNDGSVTLGSKASLILTGLQGFGSGASFSNDGKLVNDGSIVEDQNGGGMTWSQLGGSISGNAVRLEGNTKLVDRAGPAKFLVDLVGATLTGTVPRGQTITVVGAAYNSSGNEYYGTTLGLDGTSVTNDGTIVLDAIGAKNTSGGPATINDGTLRNNGTLTTKDQDPSWTAQLQAPLTNGHTGTITILGGSLVDTAGGTTTNDGTIRIAPKSLFVLNNGTNLTSMRGANIAFAIRNANSLGQLQLNSGTFTASGTLTPTLIGHAVANTDFHLFQLTGGSFKGAFTRVTGTFTADYKHQTASPAYIGAIYKATSR